MSPPSDPVPDVPIDHSPEPPRFTASVPLLPAVTVPLAGIEFVFANWSVPAFALVPPV